MKIGEVNVSSRATPVVFAEDFGAITEETPVSEVHGVTLSSEDATDKDLLRMQLVILQRECERETRRRDRMKAEFEGRTAREAADHNQFMTEANNRVQMIVLSIAAIAQTLGDE